MKFNKSIVEIITERQSKRDYSKDALSEKVILEIQSILKENNIGPLGNKVDFHFIEKGSAKAAYKVKMGTYGFISGCRYFIAGAIHAEVPYALEDYGYLLEKIILHLTDLQLGTCWLGGTFSRDDFSRVLGAEENLVIPAITPVGIAVQKNSVKQNIIRWGAKSDQRKKPDELFKKNNIETPLKPGEAIQYETALEMLRLAPSASNKQPWRIVMQKDAFHFYLLETPGYSKTIKAVKLQRVDMGIAMAHFELTCRELGLQGRWHVENPAIPNGEAVYLVSWIVS